MSFRRAVWAFLLCSILSCWAGRASAATCPTVPYGPPVTLDPITGYTLEWKVCGSVIVFRTTAAIGRGWMGLGLSPTGLMAGADVWMGYVSAGVPHLNDYLATFEGMPSLDSIQNVLLDSASQTATSTSFEFERPLDTGDAIQDRVISSGPITLLWSINTFATPLSPTNWLQHNDRGQVTLVLIPSPDGDPCSADGDCASGSCNSGFCCGGACVGACTACLSGSGACATVSGADDLDSCTGPSTCDASGACRLKDGQPASDGMLCASMFASDGVCCDTPCGGGSASDCIACSTAAGASDGTCGPVSVGTACDDANACTSSDACSASGCSGAPVSCMATDACHVAGVCDVSTGGCSSPSAPDGAPCPPGTCIGGVCVLPDGGHVVDASIADAGASPVDAASIDAGATAADAAMTDASARDAARATPDAGGVTPRSAAGCACSLTRDRSGLGGALAIVAALAIAARRRRRTD